MSQHHNIGLVYTCLISVKGTVATKQLTGISAKGCLIALIYLKFAQTTKPWPIVPLHLWLSISRVTEKLPFWRLSDPSYAAFDLLISERELGLDHLEKG